MTNAEKLARDIEFMVNACENYRCTYLDCNDCPLCDCNGRCIAREGNSAQLKEWLESEADEDGCN